ncbi:MAG TPA: FHA domain-containing protein [Ktedonobacteraceae bacterium]|nr:FHA domain-containing protein [Ktedonobacteraceae bacterium]
MPSVVQVRLVCSNQHTGSVVEYTCDLPITIGRGPANTIVIQDRAISRQHARLELEDYHLIVSDLNSANGTFVNDERIQRIALKSGDLVRIGAYQFSWTYVDAGADATVISAPIPEVREAMRAKQPASQPEAIIAARKVVEAAEAYNREQGHENDGFLSTTYGFMPVEQPLLALPASHRIWDDLVDQLPELYRTLALRQVFDRLPFLDATPDVLPDRYLLRASAMLGVFAHAYQYVETDPPPALPAAILDPWKEVSRRLGKPLPYVSYVDLFFYNWKLRDPDGPRRLDNMDLLIPAWNNQAERIFYLVTTEFAMQLTPVLNAVLQAQEAVVREDRGALEAALLIILDQLHYVTEVIYPQIDVNPLSKTHLDQVLWAKTVGTSGVPILEGAPSPSGTAQPHIHALDAFFERQSYHTLVGKQSTYLAGHFPRHWHEFVEALRTISVRQFVERSQNTALRGLYNAVLDAYVGDKGWMGLHRIKAYGFLEVAFKVGRAVTTGAKFTGLFKDKTWEKIDGELAAVRDERYSAGNQQVYFAHPKSGSVTTDPGSNTWISFIELDVAGQGVQYQPGDRIGVLSENSDALVHKTLRALQATGSELVHLTPQWQEALRFRAGYSEDIKVLPLRSVLSFGKIRPVTRQVAKRLLTISASSSLQRIIDARMEDQWELWDFLNLLYAGGYDVTRLWKAGPWDPESICRVVPPEVFRLYSIASAMEESAAGAETLNLIVGGLDYQTPHTPYSYLQARAGTASSFLRAVTSDPKFREKQLSLTIVPTPRFRLPADPARPVVMFAAGSGIAPFYGFLQARAHREETGENWLLFGTRTPDEFFHRSVFERLEAEGKLHLRMAFSRADVAARFDQEAGHYVFEKGRRQRISELIEADEQAAVLWNLLRSEREGGRQAYFYVCGKTSFAVSVMEALQRVIRRFSGGSEAQVQQVIRHLIAEGRYMQDIFTTYSGHAQEGKSYDISQVVLQNTPEAGYWIVVSGKVYDVSEFIYQHVGGERIVIHYAGMDATSAYQGVLHHTNSEVDALLGMYELGNMRRLQFNGIWGVILSQDGLKFMLLEELFTAWVRYIYLVVGMENALENDYDFAHLSSTAGEDPGELTPFKSQFLIEAHRRFLVSYLDGLIDDDLQTLWSTTIGFCAKDQDFRWLQTELEALKAREAWRLVRNSTSFLKQQLFGLNERDGAQARAATEARIRKLCQVFKAEDKRVLHDIKMALREGILAFEHYESEVANRAGGQLMTALQQIVKAVGEYYQRLAESSTAQGITLESLPNELIEEAIPEDQGLPGHGGQI